ncbi:MULTISPECIES: adenylosuccinate synthase [Sorangium]|uniref:Adenylosuccinate synthetase n=1 Tax=Sorangium cellulosum (strain So ce56) TaxID=448385 RepID=PURA_SORC5|nr:adenylosuccinate synthase [Sorangium cellulosum]A9G5S0.1 RecName: Full=Adenylosuccinate synthetase; Short=AMPSase; Short=AdSS; AltName: Full=IMP--aspartate ligase [Sorangium cellulosum So ce56]CAN99067.1 purA [Sorangium cellulosum So ce56]
MTAIVIVGAQWGDEGKGKVVDLYTESADLVVRYAGGPNAGHTLVVGGEKLIVRLIPSGILRSNARCVMAQGMVVDPGVLVSEIDAVEARGCSTQGRLFVSDRAHLILPFHPLVDSLREAAAADGVRLGTTKRGIGPCYEDKASRRGARLGDLRDMKRLAQLVSRSLEAWTPTLRALGGEPPSLDAILDELTPLAKRITPLLADTSQLIDGALRRGERVLLEGAQGTLLDIDHGTFPFVTSSSAIAGGACVGAGVGPTRIRRVLGLAKAYCTRVGEGPFPTELDGPLGERLRSVGGEYGSVTGRPRRTGWLDLPALRYAARVNGLDGIALTKLDVLTGMPELKVCVAYDTPSGRTREFPIDDIATAKPVLETVAEWSEPIDAARSMTELPAAARHYVEMVEKETGVPVDVVSVGADREATIVRRNAFA